MSLYCKGDGCARCEECLRVEAWEEFPNKELSQGSLPAFGLSMKPNVRLTTIKMEYLKLKRYDKSRIIGLPHERGDEVKAEYRLHQY